MIEASIAFSNNVRSRPLIEKRVAVEGLKLAATVVHPSEMFWRQLHYGDFDISEMSMASLLIAESRGEREWAAIPVFTMRRFFHTMIMTRRGAGIATPKDLIGRKVGVPEYQQTAAVWNRGILEEFFGVKASDIEWFMERGPDRSHGSATGFSPPAGVRLNQIPPQDDIGQMLERGDLDASLLYLSEPNLVDRARISLKDIAQPLFADEIAESRRFYAETKIFPINHTLVVRRSLLERHPWIALNLYHAYCRARDLVRADAKFVFEEALATGCIDAAAANGLGQDSAPYGLAAARPTLERIALYLHRQGLTPHVVDLDSVFAPSTRDL
jgi:4,5-dihydroxyphthalate decarboxylase